MGSLEEIFGATTLRANVHALVDETLGELESWEERKKAALSALNRQYAEQREGLRERMRRVLLDYGDDLTNRLGLERDEAACRMYFEFAAVPASVIGGVFGIHGNKVISMASRYQWPLGGECRACSKPFTTNDRRRAAQPWTAPPFCTDCHPKCRECGGRFNLDNESDQMLDRMAAGETFRCTACADRAEVEEAVAEIEELAGDRLFDVSREKAHLLFEESQEFFWDAFEDAKRGYDPSRDDSNACALFAIKVDNRLYQLGVKIPTPKACGSRSTKRVRPNSSGRAWAGSYEDYIASELWRAKRAWALERADYKCQLCAASGDDRVLHVHHNSYDRLGAELPADLIVLCDGCHYTFHDRRGVT